MRRLMMAACAAGLLAVVLSIPVDLCSYVSPGSYWSYWLGCDSGAAGGGASGASLP